MATVSVAESRKIDTPAVQDATIPFSYKRCVECPENDCRKCALGHKDTLIVSPMDPAHRTLIKFHMPVANFQVESCAVQIPAFINNNSTGSIIITKAGLSDWSEDNVNVLNAPDFGTVITNVEIPAYNNLGAIDVTAACKAAIDGEFNLYFAAGNRHFEFPSRESGNPAILHITTKDE
ncbi:hypothetical protein COEREDRAFT_83556 [Coemansia reversa NRRL 1564]|uniref:Carbohydrate-binding module family 96 domain-containing protein n=1 Tax=Coemansia reversa (strain ATCC 12441 / NRRL 1564) TaxID=763665 RepID=A0A2G5B2Q8_COERN|nr:hypothetical protein COEREDRAFT_83556 [Coemansia reversa NRRL 1564]|eukprot:PIA13309.1 hypothetical protein COEREDRAFT_83556 [Coemansia reversa NRRL 1564]